MTLSGVGSDLHPGLLRLPLTTYRLPTTTMRYSLPVLSAAQVLIAQNPEIGVESIVHVSPVEVVKLGRIVFDAAGDPTWYPKAGASFGTGLDLHLRLDSAVAATAAPSITLTVTTPTGADTAVALLSIPSWVTDQTHVYPVGKALDMVPVITATDLVTAIAGVAANANVPANTEYSVWGSPPASKFIEIGYKRSVAGPYNVPAAIPLADGYNPAAAIKQGRPEIPELSMEFLHITAMGGLARYNGHRTSVWVKVLKDKTVHAENIVYCGHRPQATPSRGDGNDEVVESSSGPYEDVLLFTAG